MHRALDQAYLEAIRPTLSVPALRRAREVADVALAGWATRSWTAASFGSADDAPRTAPLEVAAELFAAHRDAQLRALASDVAFERTERLSIHEAHERWGDPLGVFDAALSSDPADVTVVELTLRATTHREMLLNGYFWASPCTRRVHDLYIHPPGSSTWRYYPLGVLLAAIRVSTGRLFGIQLTAAESSFREVRDLLGGAPPRRPLCIGGPVEGPGTFVHGSFLDPYRMALHDLSHVIVLSSRPPERPREAVALFDALQATLERATIPHELRPRIDDLRDHLLSGYDGTEEALSYLDLRLSQAAPNLGAAQAERIAREVRARLQRP